MASKLSKLRKSRESGGLLGRKGIKHHHGEPSNKDEGSKKKDEGKLERKSIKGGKPRKRRKRSISKNIEVGDNSTFLDFNISVGLIIDGLNSVGGPRVVGTEVQPVPLVNGIPRPVVALLKDKPVVSVTNITNVVNNVTYVKNVTSDKKTSLPAGFPSTTPVIVSDPSRAPQVL